MPFSFENRYARLPEGFAESVDPSPVKDPKWIALNRDLAEFLGIDAEALDSEEGLAFLSGNQVPPGAEPLAMAYAGHQFGGFAPQLGDGRALLLGEVVARDGETRDIQLKGSGPTPFSRRGDGRSALGPVIREYLVSEGMAALGVPTTRALAAIWTGETVWREESEPGGVFARVARSHLRIGTVEYFAARGQNEHLAALVDFALERHEPDALEASNRALALLEGVSRRQASLVAKWMSLGFIHGVMNTDNMTLSGETIDYGPCAFLDVYDSAKKFSYIDRQGRYSYGNQGPIAQWNLARLAEALLPLIAASEEGGKDVAIQKAGEILEAFPERFAGAREEAFAAKLGWERASEVSAELTKDLLALMEEHEVDFTLAFRRLESATREGEAGSAFTDLFPDPGVVEPWLAGWRAESENLGLSCAEVASRIRSVNPAVIPRNHRVEEAIQAGRREDFAPFHRLLEALSAPFENRPEFAEYETPPERHEEVQVTFCGT